MNRIVVMEDLANCSGCGACASVCPQRAITMQVGKNGCVHPAVNESICVQCGRCVHVCGFYTKPKLEVPHSAYAAVGLERQLVFRSASGGVFAALAKAAADEGAMVAGAVMMFGQDGLDVFHLASYCTEDIEKMQGSKYVQSDAWRCYDEIKKALKDGKTVLFSGTPCQVAAVKALTGNPHNLITMDLICHGVPPKQMLQDYVNILERRLGGKVKELCFRDKSVWRDFTARIVLKRRYLRKTYFLKSSLMSFYAFFLKGEIYRESCYACPYAEIRRVSDITIGDYWGIQQHHGGDISNGVMHQNKNWSCVLLNTEKGQEFWDRYIHTLHVIPTNTDWIAQHNQQLQHPSDKTAEAQMLISLYSKNGYQSLEKKFIRESGGWLRYYRAICKSNQQFKKKRNL